MSRQEEYVPNRPNDRKTVDFPGDTTSPLRRSGQDLLCTGTLIGIDGKTGDFHAMRRPGAGGVDALPCHAIRRVAQQHQLQLAVS